MQSGRKWCSCSFRPELRSVAYSRAASDGHHLEISDLGQLFRAESYICPAIVAQATQSNLLTHHTIIEQVLERLSMRLLFCAMMVHG